MMNRLQAIELQGIKTFAKTSRLEFPGKITAIVGPNGSGKSNIADSVRWVLGEQSYSLLRAKRTDDMIFSGSQQRSRAGMASATILFNNEDNWLPIDYSEVSISRRAYRDGQNEYLLNGQKVRLKDISQLLSQTGLAERTYTIIGQGLVDVALALKPDERRKLFEEAAGIGLYRSRKEEALRRLDTTRKNLDRVLDIMTEIKPRLRSLERQAGRYEEFHRLRSDLDVLLREWYGYQWYQKQQDFRNIQNAYQDQEHRLHSLRKKYQAAQIRVEESRQKLQTTRKALEVAHSELSELHRSLEKLTRDLAIIDERQRSSEHQKSNLEIDIANAQEEVNELLTQEKAYKEEIDQRKKEFEVGVAEAEKAEEELTIISQKRESINQNLSEIRDQRLASQTQKVQIEAHLDELHKREQSLNQEREKIEQSRQHLSGEIDERGLKLKAIENDLSKLDDVYAGRKLELEKESARLEGFLEERQILEENLGLNETTLTKLQTQLEVLRQAEAALSGYSEGSKTLVEISRKGKLPKGIEPLSTHFIIEERFEKAISAALGELIDLLVMPSDGQDSIVDYLESKNNDRVLLFGINQTQENRSREKISERDGIFGYANDLIQAEDQYQEVVDNLFGDVLIVRDRHVAQSVLTKLSGKAKVVTLKGLVFQADGLLISGEKGSGKRLGRTRQVNELQTDINRLLKLIDEQETSKNELDQKILVIDQEYAQLKQALKDLDDERNALLQLIQSTSDQLSRQEEQLKWHDERIQGVDEALLETTSVIKANETRLNGLNIKIDELNAEEKTVSADLDQIPMFDVQQTLNHWQTHRIVTQNALNAAQSRFDEYHERIESAQKRVDNLRARLNDLTNGLQTIHENKTELLEQIQIIDQAIDLKEDEITPLQTSSKETESTVSALQKLETHSHQQLIVAERQYTQLELELSRRSDQLENLRQRIQDDFGLVSFDYELKVGGPSPLPFDDGFIENLPRVQTLQDSTEDEIKRLKSQIRRVGAINPEAQQEFIEVKERYVFLEEQIADLEKATKDLREVIQTLDNLMERDFLQTFRDVNNVFSAYFGRLFNGGEAKLVFSDHEDPVEGGVDIQARLPGRRQQGLASLSGGERSLTAVALIFALLTVSPPPFCILDEVDAMLDESNVGRFVELLRELAEKIQVVIITHNRNTVQAADVIYGVTMGRDSTSQMISLKLEDVDEKYLE